MNTLTEVEAPPERTPCAGPPPLGPAAMPMVTAKVEDIVVGRAIRFPLYDERGLLLLAEGMTFTEDFKKILAGRCIHSVRLHAEDFERLTFLGEQDHAAQNVCLDEALVRKLDEVVNSGLLLVVNFESAVANRVAQHGCTNYDRQEHLDRVNRNQQSSVSVDDFLRSALRGKPVDCGEVTRMTADYLTDITTDIDSTLASVLDTVHQSTISNHCVAMAVLGMALGVELHLDAPNVRTIALAGLLHDWGMARVPEPIRDAPRRLTGDEYFEIAKHPIYTLRLLDRMCGVPAPVPLVCYQVHERPNGGGYPHGRAGNRIHLMARILAVADAYNALISPRPYRPQLTPYAAMECLLRQAAVGDVDPQIVRALLMQQSLFPIGSYVLLSDGSVARTLRRNGDKFTQPIVRIVQDRDGKVVPEDASSAVLDLSTAGLAVVRSLPSPGTNAIGLSPAILTARWRGLGEEPPAAENAGELGPLAENMISVARQAKAKTAPTEVVSWEAYSDKQRRLARSALSVLDNSRDMTYRQYGDRRSDNRRTAKMLVTICLLDPENPLVDLRSGRAFQVMTHDLCKSGLSFIHPGPLDNGGIVVKFPGANGEDTCFAGRIVRTQEIGDTGFWAHGVVLEQRIGATRPE